MQTIGEIQAPRAKETDSAYCAIQAHDIENGREDSDNASGTWSTNIQTPLKNPQSHKMQRQYLSECTICHPHSINNSANAF